MEKDPVLEQQAVDLLKRNMVCVVATVSQHGRPSAAMMLYHVHDDIGLLYFMTREHSRKYHNLAHNQNVAIVVGADGNEHSTLQMEGVARRLDGLEDKKRFLEHIERNVNLASGYYSPFLMIRGIDFVIYEVKITWMRYMYLDKDNNIEEYYRIIG